MCVRARACVCVHVTIHNALYLTVSYSIYIALRCGAAIVTIYCTLVHQIPTTQLAVRISLLAVYSFPCLWVRAAEVADTPVCLIYHFSLAVTY